MIIASFDVGEKNFAYIVCNISIVKEELIDMRLVNIKSNSKQSVQISCERIMHELQSRNWSDCNYILIERQVKNNVRARLIAQHVWTWFRVSYPTIPVEYVQPQLKTLGFKFPTYWYRKQWAVNETLKRLEGSKFLSTFKDLRKKDDVADAYMQMIAWFQKYNTTNTTNTTGKPYSSKT